MSTTYIFNTPTNSMNFYTKSSARVNVGGTVNAYTDSNTLSFGITGVLDVTLEGAKITTNTPLMVALSGSFSLSGEWQGGLKFKYTGMGSEQSTAEAESALAKTKSALADVRQSKARLVSEATSLANRAVELGLYDFSIVP